MNVLAVMEDKSLAKFLTKAFKEEGIFFECVDNFVEGLEKFYYESFDLIVFEPIVKSIEAVVFCEKVRKEDNKIGLICLAIEDMDKKIELFRIGIDDYIIRPFNSIEFFLRIKAIYRRTLQTTLTKSLNLKFLNYELDIINRSFYRDKKTIDLTPKEFLLIEYFIRNKNIALTRTAIKEKVWGIDFDNDTNIVDVYINKIRKKIGDEAGKILQTVRGYGYTLKV